MFRGNWFGFGLSFRFLYWYRVVSGEIVSIDEGIYGKVKREGERKWDGGNETVVLFKCVIDKFLVLEKYILYFR